MKTTLTKLALISYLLFGLSGVSLAQKSLSQEDTFPISTASKLEITGLSGFGITLKTHDAKEVSFVWTISGSEENVTYQATDSGVEFVENGDRAMMQFLLRGGKKDEEYSNNNDESWIKALLNSKSKSGNYGNNSRSVDQTVVITIPRSMVLSLESKYSSITGQDFSSDVEIDNRAGNIELENVDGKVWIKNNYGNIDLTGVKGAVELEARSGNIRIDDIANSVDIVSDYAKIRAKNIGGDFSSSNKSGTIILEKINGNVTHEGNYSSIELKDVGGDSKITSKSGSLSAERIAGLVFVGDYAKVSVRSSSSTSGYDIEGKSLSSDFDDVTGSFKIEGSYGKARFDRTKGNAILNIEKGSVDMSSHSGDIEIKGSYTEFDGEELMTDFFKVFNQNGDIKADFDSAPSFIDIQNSYGDVDLKLRDGFLGTVDIQVEDGKVENSLNVTTSEQKTEDKSVTIKGSVGNGGGTLRINVIKGSVTIR